MPLLFNLLPLLTHFSTPLLCIRIQYHLDTPAPLHFLALRIDLWVKWRIHIVIPLPLLVCWYLRRHNRVDNRFSHLLIVLLRPLLHLPPQTPLLAIVPLLLLDKPFFLIFNFLQVTHLIVYKFLDRALPLVVKVRVFFVEWVVFRGDTRHILGEVAHGRASCD